ncbi:helix-turn-helix domain-containing protein [Streptomyces sp. ISL-11]|uniref:helix-turn-helix domain-containing protein n=1 Tax=Streptomyces sp. ISL-11 TaxID=2819174 RepID=UPI001BE6B592|nr:XRE family transcriptional regulator [Streptomyces sp. ISL-11]MBT2383338.1 helix-turn-helix transcriptional regulator [Streptomyces sp. ISL-11]
MNDGTAGLPGGGPAAADDRSVMEAVAARTRALRKERGWSLDALAARAHVSKGMLVALENGRSNPNLATLIRLCDAFAVPLTDLLQQPAAPLLQPSPPEEQPVLWHGPAGGTGTLLTGAAQPVGAELWHWHLAPGEEHRSEAHVAGTVELLHVLRGTLTVTAGGQEAVLPRGHGLRMAGDLPHGYANRTGSPVEYTGVVLVP